MAANARASTPPWAKQLIAEDFSASCREDRFCVTCAAAFCHHCCAEHHRGQGHEVVVPPAAASSSEGARPSMEGPAARSGIRDSFCMDCSAGFSATLCSHHGGHDTVRIVVREGRHCVRCTGSEPWFPYFYGIEMLEDENGHKLVPLHPRRGGGGARCAYCGRTLCPCASRWCLLFL